MNLHEFTVKMSVHPDRPIIMLHSLHFLVAIGLDGKQNNSWSSRCPVEKGSKDL
jgi:hypothetical protein